eukprot:TRINITY_DN23_c0_g1_i1.p1 TRINITY_DN23_c0_g1~~TRINITY_DN23_c0_g1_i1.p1  ORF type:complete len:439 (+),score=130.32 TRINITY_DN23_c0_g1_i1:50-1366(+)
MSTKHETEEEREIRKWKMKRLITNLGKARGSGTSMISLIIPPGDQIGRASRLLAEEYGTASNIKSRVNRLSVLSAITSAQNKVKLYNKVPPTGLAIFCGTVTFEDGKKKDIKLAIEPFKEINTSLYFCDSRFHVEPLQDCLDDDTVYGFIVMDGNGTLFGTLSGNARNVRYKFSVDLPKKHGRGGQSAVRFARLRMEKRHNYVRKVTEHAKSIFIGNDNMPNVAGLVLAGLADFKNELRQSDMFDPRLKDVVVDVVDTSYGMENGFNQAIELSAGTLSNQKFLAEKKLICSYFEEIAKDTGKYCFGVKDTFYALDNGAVETLMVWENLEIERVTCNSAGREEILHLTPEQALDSSNLIDRETGQEMDVLNRELLLDWLTENYKQFGTKLVIVSDRSQEGTQFVKGFGGFGGIMRYELDFTVLDYLDDEDMYDDYELFF